MHHTARDLHLLICEDEPLLAIDMAQQLEAFGAKVVDIVDNAAALQSAAANGQANAAILDIRLGAETVYDSIAALEAAGMVLAFCTGYTQQERPDHLAHIPWFTKPASTHDIATALCAALDARSASHNS